LDNDGILPLSLDTKVAIIGDFAKVPRYQGAGSSQVNPTRLDNLYECAIDAGMQITSYAQGYDRKSPHPNKELIDEAVRVAKDAQAVLLCVGLEEILESEGMDRLHMLLSKSQQALIRAVCAANTNVILVLSGGAPFVMPDRSQYRAAIHGYLSGQAGAGAMVDALLGKFSPSGKLNETWPLSLADTPCANYFPGKQHNCEYREGLFVGYRYYDTAKVPVRYPFGYGLGYTEFAYSDLSVQVDAITFTITNTGKMDGAEVAQLYIACPKSGVYRPKKELKGFKKVFLKAGESKQVTIPLEESTFRYFNVHANTWEIEDGDYQILIASDANTVHLQDTIHIAGEPATDNVPACYHTANIQTVSDDNFRQLLGREIPAERTGKILTINDAFCDLINAKSLPARFLGRILTRMKEKADKKGTPNLNIMFVYNMPFRALSKLSMGLASDKMAEDFVFLANGHFFRGLGRLIRDFFKNLSQTRKFKRKLSQYEQDRK
jgi:beta-glucosidase